MSRTPKLMEAKRGRGKRGRGKRGNEKKEWGRKKGGLLSQKRTDDASKVQEYIADVHSLLNVLSAITNFKEQRTVALASTLRRGLIVWMLVSGAFVAAINVILDEQ